jgi:hypothetical protein
MTLPVPMRPAPSEAACSAGSKFTRNPLLWLGLAALAATGSVLNWNWLVAAGALPILFGVLPCLAMCVLHLCSMGKGRSPGADTQPTRT